jgi:hypothetical protein
MKRTGGPHAKASVGECRFGLEYGNLQTRQLPQMRGSSLA